MFALRTFLGEVALAAVRGAGGADGELLAAAEVVVDVLRMAATQEVGGEPQRSLVGLVVQEARGQAREALQREAGSEVREEGVLRQHGGRREAVAIGGGGSGGGVQSQRRRQDTSFQNHHAQSMVRPSPQSAWKESSGTIGGSGPLGKIRRSRLYPHSCFHGMSSTTKHYQNS